MAKSSGISKYAMWVLMGLLILALGGFGAANLSGNIRTIGSVGDKSIPVDQYARQLSAEIRAIEAQSREQLPFARVQALGLDRAVLQRIVRNRALDNEADQLGLSIGDETLRQEILQISAFQGVDGNFDREGYRFALQQGGLSEAEFETSLREEASRALLQNAVLGGVKMPDTYAQTLLEFAGEQRGFTYAILDETALETPVATPTGEELRAFYDANGDQFTLPASKSITYAWLSPEMMLDEVEIEEDTIRALYEERINQFVQPERRLVERLVFPDQDAAAQAAAALADGTTTFNALVSERGLNLADVDLGDVSAKDLGDAGDAVFATEPGRVTEPQPSTLGPALFRVNGVLPASETTFEQARTALREELAMAAARRTVEARAQDLDDQLAGGITLEELANTTEMTLGTLDWSPEVSADIAAYTNFREAAADLTADDFPKIEQLEDGGIFAIRLDDALPQRPNPFEDATSDVREALLQERTLTALTVQAENVVKRIQEGGSFADAGLDVQTGADLTRTGFVEGTSAAFMAQVFELEIGDVTTVAGDGNVVVVQLDTITPAADDADAAAQLDQLSAQIDQTLAQDLFNVFNDVILLETPPQIDQRAVNAVHVNFP